MRKVFFFLACFFIWAGAVAQQYPFVQYTPKDGLVNSRVRKIYQDSKGRMYFITYGGLSVYDGARFLNYTRQEGLANDLVNDVFEISPDTILVATNTDTLNMLVNGKVGQYPIRGAPTPLINRFLKSSEGQIYVGSDNGLFLLHANRFERLPVIDKQGNDAGLYFDKIIEWGNYFLILPWDNRPERIFLYDWRKRIIKDVYSSASVSNIKSDKDGNVWLSTYSGLKMLDKDSLQKGKLREKDIPAKYSSLAKGVLTFFDKAGDLWAYASNDIRVISPLGNEQIISPDHGLKTGYVLDLFEDREGIIWMATDGNGVIKMRGTNTQLLNSLPGNHPLSISSIQQQEDTLWLYNSTDNTICRLHNNEVRAFPFRPGTIYIHGSDLYVVSSKELLWITDKDTPGSYKRPKIFGTLAGAERFGWALVDPYGAFIILKGSADDRFSICVYKDGKLIAQHPISFMGDNIMVDKQRRLWIVTRDDHIMVFTLHPETPSKYLQLEQDYSKQLPPMNPRTFTVDLDGNAWIGTRYNGIYKIEISGAKVVSVKRFTTHDGLTDNFIYSIACDKYNNIWAGTQSGLDKLFLKDGKYVTSNVSKNNNFFQAIYNIVITKNNTLWAATGEGTILKIVQTPASAPATPPSLLLTLSEVNSNPAIGLSNSFSYRQSNFSFNVAAPSFFDEKSILYSYQLLGGGNDNWSAPSHNSYFNFSNLSPGHYTLNATAQFPEAIYPPQSASYTFTILPPWWQTVLFRLIAASSVMGLLIIGFRFYYSNKLRRQKAVLERKQAIEKERTRIATDMHDDLGAGLSRIKFLSETIGIKRLKEQPIEDDISSIRYYSHEMIDKMGEIVWALNEKNDSLSDLLAYTRAYAVEYLSQNGIRCVMETPDDFPSSFVSGEFRRNIYLSVKEALHNIVKHSQANSVSIRFTILRGLIITIRDDGTGFDKNKTKPYSNGLTNMQKRMKELGGSFEIESSNGTTIKLTAPMPS